MDFEHFKRRLRHEAWQYLADLRNMLNALRALEGKLTLALVLLVIVILTALFVMAMGFDRLNSFAGASGVWRPRLCRPLGDIQALFFVLIFVVMVLLSILSIGEMMRLFDRAQHKLPLQPRAVLVPTLFLLGVAIGGYFFLGSVC